MLLFIGQNYSFKIGILKYNGGGDWYANPTALKNLIQFCNTNLNTNIDPPMMKLNWKFIDFSIPMGSFNRSWKCSF